MVTIRVASLVCLRRREILEANDPVAAIALFRARPLIEAEPPGEMTLDRDELVGSAEQRPRIRVEANPAM
jgi:hypothetical protein